MEAKFLFSSGPVPFLFFTHTSLGLFDSPSLQTLDSLGSRYGDSVENAKEEGKEEGGRKELSDCDADRIKLKRSLEQQLPGRGSHIG